MELEAWDSDAAEELMTYSSDLPADDAETRIITAAHTASEASAEEPKRTQKHRRVSIRSIDPLKESLQTIKTSKWIEPRNKPARTSPRYQLHFI